MAIYIKYLKITKKKRSYQHSLLRGAAARAVSMVTRFGIISGESPHQLPQSRYYGDRSGVCFFSLVLFVFFFHLIPTMTSDTHTEKHVTTATTRLHGYSKFFFMCLATNRGLTTQHYDPM